MKTDWPFTETHLMSRHPQFNFLFDIEQSQTSNTSCCSERFWKKRCFSGKMSVTGQPRKIVIDTDPGVDDAMAIFVALERHRRREVDILAVTLVNGNTDVDNQVKNIRRIFATVPESLRSVRWAAAILRCCVFVLPGILGPSNDIKRLYLYSAFSCVFKCNIQSKYVLWLVVNSTVIQFNHQYSAEVNEIHLNWLD